MDVIPYNVHWLVPEEQSPCDIFLHFRGNYILALSKGQPAAFDFFEKLVKSQTNYIYVSRSAVVDWDAYCKQRHGKPSLKNEPSETKAYGNKRAEIISYLQKSFHPKNSSEIKIAKTFEQTAQSLQAVVSSPMLDWYFHQFHEPPDLFQHCGRVTYMLALFAHHYEMLPNKELLAMMTASLIHELQGDPKENIQAVVSEQTLTYLEKHKYPIPGEIIELIKMQDELFSGKGFPNNKKGQEIPLAARSFQLCNHFDHYRMRASGTRRAKFDAAKKNMESRKQDYDPMLWEQFWNLLQEVETTG